MTLIGIKNVVWLGGAKVISALFASMYETFNALISILPQHFIEWFSGSVLDNIWTVTETGTGTQVMDDSVDGGFLVTTSTGAADKIALNFNNKRQYAHDGSIFICVAKRFTSGVIVGFNDTLTTWDNPSNEAGVNNKTGASFQSAITSNGTTQTETNSSVAVDTSFHVYKGELDGTDFKLTIDGVLEVTKTTNLPTAKMQPNTPFTFVQSGIAGKAAIRYWECFNTDVTILSSLYERLFALTEVMKQRIIETFSGSVINERWTTNNVQGTNTFQMADVVDGGFEIITGTTANDDGSITFNDKRQYDFNASIIIFVMQQITAASYRCQAGFSDSNNLPSGDSAYIDNNTDFTNYRLLTFRLGGGTATNTDIAKDLLVHSFKVETKASSVEGFMDGVLKATNTTNLPAVKMQPLFAVRTLTTAAKTGRIRYLEAYNIGTTPLVDSVYELFNKLTTIAKQHFWEWFSGSTLHNRWTTRDIVGTGTFAMSDTVGGGFTIQSGNGTQNHSCIDFNNKRQYSETGCVTIFVAKLSSLTNKLGLWGLYKDAAQNDFTEIASQAAVLFSNTPTTFSLRTQSDTVGTDTDTGLTIDTNAHSFKIECKSSSVELTIDGVLEATNSTNLPEFRLQPKFMSGFQGSGASMTSHIIYCEARNT